MLLMVHTVGCKHIMKGTSRGLDIGGPTPVKQLHSHFAGIPNAFPALHGSMEWDLSVLLPLRAS